MLNLFARKTSADALTEIQESFLSGCRLDNEGTEEKKTNEAHRVAVLATLEKSLTEYKAKYNACMQHIAVNMASLPSQMGATVSGEDSGPAEGEAYKFQSRHNLLQGKLSKAAGPSEVSLYQQF